MFVDRVLEGNGAHTEVLSSTLQKHYRQWASYNTKLNSVFWTYLDFILTTFNTYGLCHPLMISLSTSTTDPALDPAPLGISEPLVAAVVHYSIPSCQIHHRRHNIPDSYL